MSRQNLFNLTAFCLLTGFALAEGLPSDRPATEPREPNGKAVEHVGSSPIDTATGRAAMVGGARLYLRYHDSLWCYDVRDD